MDANKSECEKCIRIAKSAAQENNFEKAIKFLEKSIRLYPTELAKNLLEEYKESYVTKTTSSSRRNSKKSDDETENSESQRRPSYSSSSTNQTSSNNTSKKGAKQAEYSSDQADAVKKIKSCRDFYEILGVPKSATDADLKKAYKKLALQFHPDKNKAPGTTDAFKAIGKAFAILSDTQKRKHYDDYGPEFFDQTSSGSSNTTSRHRSSHGRSDHHYNYSHWNQEEFSADELFNLFFGRNYAAASHATHRARHQEGFARANVGAHHNLDNNTVLLQFLPIILIVVLALFSNLMISDPLFSLQKTNKYTSARTTNNHRITYFVKSDFKLDNYNDLKKLERQVEDEYHNELRQSCFREKSYREAAIWRARNYGDERMIKKAMDYEMPACDRINHVFGAG